MKSRLSTIERKFFACLCGSGFVLGVLALCHGEGSGVAIATLGTLWSGLVVTQHLAERRDRDGGQK